MNQTEAIEILELVLKLSEAEGIVARVWGSTSSTTRLADNLITQNIRCARATLNVECAYGQSHGSASTDNLNLEAMRNAVQRAQSIAKVSPPDPEHMPPVEAAETRKYSQPKAYFETTAGFSPPAKAQQLAAAAKMVGEFRGQTANFQTAGNWCQSPKFRLSGAYSNWASFHAVANSAGLRAYHSYTDADLHTTVLGPNGSGWAELFSNNTADIQVETVAAKALGVAQQAQNPQPLEAGKYDVVLSPAAAGELLLFTFWCGFDAKATDEERTFLRGRLGKKVFGDAITIRSDPADSRCPGEPFQNDGMASATLPWVERGVVKNLCYSRFWAKKQGKEPTGWPVNILMDGGNATTEQMVASIERGLLITRFWYIRHVDPMVPLLTGMTRDGLFLIEKGKVTRPVQHMRFNENMVDVLNRVEMLGPVARTGEYPMLIPSLKVKNFNFTSTTKF